MFVKICGITNEDDALLAIALGADALGFVFAPSPRQMVAQKVYDITRRLPPEVLTVGVFRDEHPQRVIEITQAAGLRAAQLHGHESPADVVEVCRHIRTVIKAVTAGSVDVTRAKDFASSMILLDAPAPGSGKVFDWKLAGEIPDGVTLILAGGLTPENVGNGIAQVRPFGVDVSSGVESSPGRKDPVLLRRFMDEVRQAAASLGSGSYEEDSGTPYDWMDE
jgi:phosphoribosylanthranilate isomerase